MLGSKHGSDNPWMELRAWMLRATGLSAHSVDRADQRAQSVDSGNPWIELNVAGFAKAVALSRKDPGVAGRCCARERVVLCARVRIGQETGSMRCTCTSRMVTIVGKRERSK